MITTSCVLKHERDKVIVLMITETVSGASKLLGSSSRDYAIVL